MSTKIYDAYVIKNLSQLELKKFIQDLKQIVFEEALTNHFKLLSQKVLELCDELRVYDHLEDYEIVEKRLLNVYRESGSFNRLVKDSINGKTKELNIDEVLETMKNNKFSYSILQISKDIIEFNRALAEIDETIMTMEYCIDESLVLFPLSKRRTLFVAFGGILPNILYKYSTSNEKECISFREEYGFGDYHYQNQTDRPDNVSAREWARRRKDWDKVIPRGSYAENGIVVNILDRGNFEHSLFGHGMGSYMHLFPTKAQRIERLAKMFARDEYYNEEIKKISEPSISDSMHILNQFGKLVEKEEDEVMFLISDKYEEIKDVIEEINTEMFFKSILSLVPNYIKYKKGEDFFKEEKKEA